MERSELQRSIEAILFAAGEPVSIERMSAATASTPDDVEECAQALMDEYAFARRGIRIVRLEDSFQMCSSPEQAEYVTKVCYLHFRSK